MKVALPIVLALLMVTGCSSSGGTSPTDPVCDLSCQSYESDSATTAETLPATSCTLTSDHDIVFWTKTPGQDATAQQLGAVNLALCKYVADTLADTSTTSAGYCTAVADIRDNPGYNFDAVPAPKPKNVAAEVGEGC